MTPTTQNRPQTRPSQLSDRLFLGQVLAETYGFNCAMPAVAPRESAGWTSHQLLKMSAARGQNSLA